MYVPDSIFLWTSYERWHPLCFTWLVYYVTWEGYWVAPGCLHLSFPRTSDSCELIVSYETPTRMVSTTLRSRINGPPRLFFLKKNLTSLHLNSVKCTLVFEIQKNPMIFKRACENKIKWLRFESSCWTLKWENICKK